MKHWDERERTDVEPARLSRRDRERLRDLFEPPAHRRQRRTDAGSLVGLAVSIAVLAGVALLLAPNDPVSSRILP